MYRPDTIDKRTRVLSFGELNVALLPKAETAEPGQRADAVSMGSPSH